MKKIWLVTGSLLLLLLAGCGEKDAGSLPAVPTTPVAAGDMTLQLEELVTDPVAFEGKLVQVSGRYSVLPMPPCDSALYLPPATWLLGDGGVIVRMAGLQGILEALASDGLAMTVEGRWERWDGWIGCGDAAVSSTIWYLQAMRILSPNPLVRATFTPLGGAPVPTGEAPGPLPTLGTPSSAPTQSSVGSATQTAIATFAQTSVATSIYTPTPTSTSSSSPLSTPAISPSPAATSDGPLPTLSPPSSPTLIPSGTVLATFTPDFTATTPTSTPQPTTEGTVLPTFTPMPTATGTITPTPTPTSSGGSGNQGEAEIDKVVNAQLAAGETHVWYYNATAGDVITITVGPARDVDLELVVNDPQGTWVTSRDYTPVGGAETIVGLILDQDEEYQILVNEVYGEPGDYALVVMDRDSTTIRFTGNLSYGASRSTSLPADTDHLWHFQGTAGDNITIRLAPTDNSDLAFVLYGPDMDDQPDRVDGSGSGGAEQSSFQLAETGFYTIWIEVYGGGEGGYELSLTDG